MDAVQASEELDAGTDPRDVALRRARPLVRGESDENAAASLTSLKMLSGELRQFILMLDMLLSDTCTPTFVAHPTLDTRPLPPGSKRRYGSIHNNATAPKPRI